MLPPGPEFDPDVTANATSEDVQNAALAAVDLAMPGHFGFQKKLGIVEISTDQNRPTRDQLFPSRRDRSDHPDGSSKIPARKGANFQQNVLANGDIRQFLFGNRNFGADSRQIMHAGNQISPVYTTTDHFL